MNYGFLNVGSLVLGLIAWILPMASLAKRNKDNHKNWVFFSLASMSALAISLCMQIIYGDHLVKIEDWSALMDTSGAVMFASAILLIVTIVLNIVTATAYRKKDYHNPGYSIFPLK